MGPEWTQFLKADYVVEFDDGERVLYAAKAIKKPVGKPRWAAAGSSRRATGPDPAGCQLANPRQTRYFALA